MEITIESFLKERIAKVKQELSIAKTINNSTYVSELILSLSTFSRLDQMLFVIRANNELNLIKDVGDINVYFGRMMQKIILDMVETNACLKSIYPVTGLRGIYDQVLKLTGVDQLPSYDNDHRSIII